MSEQKSRVRLTAGRVADFTCPHGKSQAFLWDTDTPALALRVTPTGRKTYVFESRLHGSTIRVTIGTAAEWSLEAARTRAQALKMMVDSGTDPREVERQQQAEREAQQAAAAVQSMTVGEAWTVYLADRRQHWGERHYQDHEKLARAGGATANRGTRWSWRDHRRAAAPLDGDAPAGLERPRYRGMGSGAGQDPPHSCPVVLAPAARLPGVVCRASRIFRCDACPEPRQDPPHP